MSLDVRKHERVLLHVHSAKTFGKTRTGRLGANELFGGLCPVTHRERAFHVKFAGTNDALDQVFDVDGSEGVARGLRFAHVALDHAGVGAAHLWRSARRLRSESPDRTQGFRRAGPSGLLEAGSFQYTPTVVVAANSRNGRTPLTPSHGYFA